MSGAGKAVRLLAAAGLVLVFVFAFVTARLLAARRETEAEAAAWEEAQPEPEEEEADDTIEYNGKRYRRLSSVKAILLLGVDRRGTLEETRVAGSGGQADGIFLAAQDTARDSVRLLVIPRDTMTEIMLTDLSGNELGWGVQHLTLAYGYGDGREKSLAYMAEAVSRLLCGLKIDGTLAAGIDAIAIANDAVGGVMVTIDDEALVNADAAFTYGSTLTLSGAQAERFVRYRDITQDHTALLRGERQKQYIAGFAAAAKKAAAADDAFAAGLMEELAPCYVTDMAKEEYLDLGLSFLLSGQSVSEEDLLTLPGTGVTTDMFDEFYPDEEQLVELVLELFYREEE